MCKLMEDSGDHVQSPCFAIDCHSQNGGNQRMETKHIVYDLITRAPTKIGVLFDDVIR